MPDPVRQRASRRPARRRRAAAAALAAPAALALLLSACGSSGSGSQGDAASPGHPVTLVVQCGDGGDTGLLAAYAALNKQFEAAHPGVHIKFVVKSFGDLIPTLKLQLSGGSGVPAVTQDNEGYSSLGVLVTDHLVQSLDSIAAANHWTARQSPSLLALDGKFSSDGKHMGTGSLYGISATGTWIGLFENTAAARKLGIKSAPASFADLQHDLALAKSHGVLPLGYGASDQGESSWLLGEILMAQSSPQTLTGVVDAASSTLPASMTSAAQTLLNWQNAGYFTPSPSAYTSQDVFNKFLSGSSLFVLNGSWNVPLPGSAAKNKKFEMIPFPLTGGGKIAAIASGDLPWSIPAKSPQPKLAAQYINFITSPAADAAWIANGQVPASLAPGELKEVAKAHLSPASAQATAGWLDLVQKGTVVPYMDWATPTFLTTIGSAAESLVAGKVSPASFMSKLQADYGPFTTQRRG
jgi:raffinose/stachyose/melibiose transport system substrate-binding protein